MNCPLKFRTTVLILACLPVSIFAEEVDMSDWLDPINRDEDISNSIVSATVSQFGHDLFEYVYRIESSTNNKGNISDFELDLSCELVFDEVELPAPTNPEINSDSSADGQHVPAVIFGAEGGANPLGISIFNQALWVLTVGPGEVAEGFSVISPAPPGLRTYKMEADFDSFGWRYDLYEEGDPRIKWVSTEFQTQGEVIGPACRIDDDEPEIAFLGTAEEPFGINKLLAYADPISDSIETDGGSFALTVFYDENIDINTFKAKLGGKDVSSSFTPEPGTFEAVSIEGMWKKNTRLHLSVLGKINDKTRGNSKFKSIDNDVFSITSSN